MNSDKTRTATTTIEMEGQASGSQTCLDIPSSKVRRVTSADIGPLSEMISGTRVFSPNIRRPSVLIGGPRISPVDSITTGRRVTGAGLRAVDDVPTARRVTSTGLDEMITGPTSSYLEYAETSALIGKKKSAKRIKGKRTSAGARRGKSSVKPSPTVVVPITLESLEAELYRAAEGKHVSTDATPIHSTTKPPDPERTDSSRRKSSVTGRLRTPNTARHPASELSQHSDRGRSLSGRRKSSVTGRLYTPPGTPRRRVSGGSLSDTGRTFPGRRKSSFVGKLRQTKKSTIDKHETRKVVAKVKNQKTARRRWNAIKKSVWSGQHGRHLSQTDSFLQKFSAQHSVRDYEAPAFARTTLSNVGGSCGDGVKPYAVRCVIPPQGTTMYTWLLVLTLAVLYNLWTVIAREAFNDILDGYEVAWFAADAVADLIYLLDIVVQMRTGFLESGLLVCETRSLFRHYTHSRMFIMDVLSLTPLDLLQLYVGIHPILRFARFLKVYRTLQFINIVSMRSLFPNMWRVAILTHMLFLSSHWLASFYFLISRAENFEGTWSYPRPVGEFENVGRKYLMSLYWATLTLTTIGDLRAPERNWE